MSANVEAVNDFAWHEGTFESNVDAIQSEYGITIIVLQEVGPGGGWPEVLITGPKDRVVAALMAQWGLTEAEALYDIR